MLTVRYARSFELDEIWALVSASVEKMNAEGNDQWGPDYPLRSDYRRALDAGQLYAAGEEGGPILGTAVFNTEEDPEYAALDGWTVPPPALVVHKLAVAPAVRRRGVATALLRYAYTLAEQWGVNSIRMDTYTRNRAMLALMEREGFRFVGEVFFPDRGLPFLVHEKRVGKHPAE